jgi:DUF1009 family protein
MQTESSKSVSTHAPTSGEPIGIIAGQGMLPISVADGLKAQGHPVICAALCGQSLEAMLQPRCDQFKRVGLLRINQWIRWFRHCGVSKAIMVGRVAKAGMYEKYRMLRYIPDWRTARVWFWRIRHDKRSARLLSAVADELASGGITLLDARPYIPQELAVEGLMTRTRPASDILADIDFGWPLLRDVNRLLIGQSIAVKDREVIAVEAMEGTDALIERAAGLCKRGGWVLLKASNPNQDIRFDVPTVGPQTMENLIRGRAAALVLESGRTIMLEKQRLLQMADDAGIAVLGRP